MATIKSIEEKAKAYDEASKWMEGIYPTLTHEQQMEAEAFFQIFKESEDEKIRKELVQFFEEKDEEDFEEWIPKAKVLAWLEKQGKQKETLCDKCKKTQPSHSCQDITALGRCALEKQGEQKLTEFERAVKQVMEEAIECGDTRNLKADAEMLLSLVHKSADKVKPRYSTGDVVCDKLCTTLNKDAQPNLEIVNIEDGVYICDKGSFPISQQDNFELVAKKIEQNPAWSEEDEEMLNSFLHKLEVCDLLSNKEGIWIKNKLKSLKNRVQPQSTWKPSGEQMAALKFVIESLDNMFTAIGYMDNYTKPHLEEILEALKKLREE